MRYERVPLPSGDVEAVQSLGGVKEVAGGLVTFFIIEDFREGAADDDDGFRSRRVPVNGQYSAGLKGIEHAL